MRMQKIFIIFVLLITGIGALLSVPSEQELDPIMTMPWETTIMDDGNIQVFGIHLGKTTLEQAQHIFNLYGKTAIFSQPNHELTIESYFDSINLGGLSAKVILNLMLPEQQIQDLLIHTTNDILQPSGARSYELHNDNTSLLLNLPIISITYIPTVTLDENMILNRFGKAENIQQISINKPSYFIWYYPKIGLSITFNNQEKAVLQYGIIN